jgi:hypothetical protein
MNNRISIVILAACLFFTHWCANATDESGLVGSWQTAEDSPSIYNFAKDHSVTEWWFPKDHSVTETYKGLNIVQAASMAGHWKLDGKQLVITMDSEFVPESSGKGTTVHLSSKQGTTAWTIVSDSRWTMTWSTTTSHDCVSRSIELKLRRIDGPLIAIN